MKSILLTIILLTTFSIDGHSCDCEGERRPIEELLRTSKYIFIGTVKSVGTKTNKTGDYAEYSTIKFNVDEIFVGQKVKTVTILNENTSCGQVFEKGKRYLVYVYFDSNANSLTVHQCYSPCPALDRSDAKTDINEIRKIIKDKK